MKARTKMLLKYPDLADALHEIRKIPAEKAVNALISCFYEGDPGVRWKAVTALGRVAADIADKDMEAARVLMRRLMWSLNDESGGIGWGAPEAMAESMACHEGLLEEYVRILLSYVREDGNYLEYEPLRRGALWGIMRLCRAWPENMKSLGAPSVVRPYLHDSDPVSVALAVLSIGETGDLSDCSDLRRLIDVDSRVTLYLDDILVTESLGHYAARACRLLGC